jgi:uncharacterized protein with PQ loop repeat
MEQVGQVSGYVGAGLITLMTIPQVIHTYKTRDATGLSWYTLVCQFLVGVAFLIYGVSVATITDINTALPLLISNPINMTAVAILMIMKRKYVNEIQASTV